jgi:hypothetical protein
LLKLLRANYYHIQPRYGTYRQNAAHDAAQVHSLRHFSSNGTMTAAFSARGAAGRYGW